MARKQTLVQLNDELLALLDQRAGQLRISRSDLIRRALESFLASEREAALDRAIVAGYERVPAEADRWAMASARRSIADEPW